MEKRRKRHKFKTLFHTKPDAYFKKLKLQNTHYNKSQSEWKISEKIISSEDDRANESGIEIQYFQNAKDIEIDGNGNIDISQGIDYHYYILQNIYIYELKKPNIQSSSSKILHNCCLENRLAPDKLVRLNNEYIDYLLWKSRKPIKSIYKKIGTNFRKKSPQNYLYEDIDDFTTVVINGTDDDTMRVYINKLIRAVGNHYNMVINTSASAFSFTHYLHQYVQLFDPSMEILWNYMILADEKIDEKNNTTNKHITTLMKMSQKIKKHLSLIPVDFEEFCEALSDNKKKQMISEYKYHLLLTFVLIAPVIMGIITYLDEVIPLKCLRNLLIMLEKFTMRKFVSDLSPNTYYVQFKPS